MKLERTQQISSSYFFLINNNLVFFLIYANASRVEEEEEAEENRTEITIRDMVSSVRPVYLIAKSSEAPRGSCLSRHVTRIYAKSSMTRVRILNQLSKILDHLKC